MGFVDDGQQLGEMVLENLVEEALVAVVALAEQSVDGAAILIEVQRMTAADIVLPQDLPAVVVDSGPRSRYPAIDNNQSSGARLDAGRDLPGDVSVMGFDEMPESANFVPPLTTTTQPPTQTPPPRGNRHGAAGDHRLVRCPSPCRRGR